MFSDGKPGTDRFYRENDLVVITKILKYDQRETGYLY